MEREKHKPDEKGMKIYIDRGRRDRPTIKLYCANKRGEEEDIGLCEKNPIDGVFYFLSEKTWILNMDCRKDLILAQYYSLSHPI